MRERLSRLGFPCVKCGQPVVVFEIPATKATPAITGGLTRMLRCPACFTYAQYHTDNLVRFEEPESQSG